MAHSANRISCEPNHPSKLTKIQIKMAILHSHSINQAEIMMVECHQTNCNKHNSFNSLLIIKEVLTYYIKNLNHFDIYKKICMRKFILNFNFWFHYFGVLGFTSVAKSKR